MAYQLWLLDTLKDFYSFLIWKCEWKIILLYHKLLIGCVPLQSIFDFLFVSKSWLFFSWYHYDLLFPNTYASTLQSGLGLFYNIWMQWFKNNNHSRHPTTLGIFKRKKGFHSSHKSYIISKFSCTPKSTVIL